MDFGGFDIEFPGRTSVQDICVMLHKMREQWPEAVVEEHDNEDVAISIGLAETMEWEIPLGLYIHKNQESRKSWAKLGADDSNLDTLIAIMIENDGIYFTIDCEGMSSHEIVIDAKKAIDWNRNIL